MTSKILILITKSTVKQNLFFVGDAFGSESSSITYMKMYIKNGARDIQ